MRDMLLSEVYAMCERHVENCDGCEALAINEFGCWDCGLDQTPNYWDIDDTPMFGKWIPCSERLPEESGKYICTAQDGQCTRVTYAQYLPRVKRWQLTGAMSYWRIIAWMPLPEAFKEGNE